MQVKSYLLEENLSLIKNLSLFYGENLGLKDEFKKKIKNKYTGVEVLKINQDDILKNSSIFFREIDNFSLFEKKKIIFVDQVNDKILDIIIEARKNLNDTQIYLFSDLLEKKSKLRKYFEESQTLAIIACYSDNEIGIRKIVQKELIGFKGLTSQNLNIIIDNCNLDRMKLNNELEKIKIFFKDKNIETEKLQSLLNIRVNEDFNLLKDAALSGNKIKTNKLLNDTIFEDEKNIYYLNLISQRLLKLNELNNLTLKLSLDKAISSLKPPIFWKDKINFIDQAKKWNSKKIKLVLGKAYNFEVLIKSNSSINKNILIKKFIVDLCDLANA